MSDPTDDLATDDLATDDLATYDLKTYVEDLRRICREESDDKKIVRRVAPLAQRLVAAPDFIKDEHYTCDEALL